MAELKRVSVRDFCFVHRRVSVPSGYANPARYSDPYRAYVPERRRGEEVE